MAEGVSGGMLSRKHDNPNVKMAAALKKTTKPPIAVINVPPAVDTLGKSNSKFHPRPIPNKGRSSTPVVEGKVPRGSSILIIQRPWSTPTFAIECEPGY